MKHLFKATTKNRQRGQSLVEVALAFPIFVILMAGVVEVSHLVITQNRISNAARVSSRFGANGGEDDGMWKVALNSVTQTLDLDEEKWDIWSIRATVNDDGNDFNDWTVNHIYGISNTAEALNVDWTVVKDEVLEQLQTDQFGDSSNVEIAGDLRVVGAYILYDVESILGLDALPALAGINSIRGLNVMRVSGLNIVQTNGCSAFPIAVQEGVRSLTDVGGGNPYPAANEFDYPNGVDSPPPPSYAYFTANVPQIPFPQGQEGYVYKIQNGSGEGNFGWLVWNTGITASAPTLGASLTWPGNSNDYSNHGDGGQAIPGSGYNYVVRGYVEPGDPTDQTLHVEDLVAGDTGAVNANEVRGALEGLIDKGSTIRVIVWQTASGTGVNARYVISGFAIVRLHGYHLSQGQGGSWILAEFIRWDASCGQLVE